MKRAAAPELDPASLPAGTRIGPWRVEGWGGCGTYGVVYRAVYVGNEEAGCVALKLALEPEDPLFEREVKLLSGLSHPNVPRLLGHGGWRHPSGAVHPYYAMQWVQGKPLSLEEAAEQAGSEADHPLFAWAALSPASWSPEDVAIAVGLHQRARRRDRQVARLSEQRDSAEQLELEHQARTERGSTRATNPPWRPRLSALAVGTLMILGIWWMEHQRSREAFMVAQEDGGTTALGDDALPPYVAATTPPTHGRGVHLDMPPKPFKGQRRAPCSKGDVEIRGGCWGKMEARAPDCPEYAYEWLGGCYVPVIAAQRPSTSEQP
ncbi:hypothetical protein [Hyalangium rubrum]|uniref:Protein kinase domain-containing protein n=1 Tax=Hyalangium rubrum TaxID=3103134 RepID=A0ABU5GYG0_9BACT|nr:hypothetical protein [Hyalangium sp. s54d21]MDY7226218.1 hypothetical protein [Hyalangium sp. s54d21]